MKEVGRYKRKNPELSGKHGGGCVIVWGAFQPFVLRILWHYECSKVLSDWCYGKNIEHASPMAICRQVWLHVPKCVLIYLLPGVKVLYYILPEGIFIHRRLRRLFSAVERILWSHWQSRPTQTVLFFPLLTFCSCHCTDQYGGNTLKKQQVPPLENSCITSMWLW